MSISKKNLLPPNITVSAAFLQPIEEQCITLFSIILNDYALRFKAEITKKPYHVAMCGVDTIGGAVGVTVNTKGRILIQVEDPFLFSNIEEQHRFTSHKFLEVLCHEIIHSVQTLTSRKGLKRFPIPHDKNNESEKYYFEREEMEARVLEGFYTEIYAIPLFFDKK